MHRAPCWRSSTSGSWRTNSKWSPTRSAVPRSGVSARENFLNPPSSPTTLCRLFGLGLAGEEAVPAGRHRLVAMALERGAVVVRHHLHEPELRFLPVVEDVSRDGRVGASLVLLDQLAKHAQILELERLQADELGVAALRERAVLVEHVCDPTAHAGGEVPARAPEDDDGAARHVFATVVADALDDRGRTRVPDREPLAGETAEERLARGRSVEDRVPRHDVLLGPERG